MRRGGVFARTRRRTGQRSSSHRPTCGPPGGGGGGKRQRLRSAQGPMCSTRSSYCAAPVEPELDCDHFQVDELLPQSDWREGWSGIAICNSNMLVIAIAHARNAESLNPRASGSSPLKHAPERQARAAHKEYHKQHNTSTITIVLPLIDRHQKAQVLIKKRFASPGLPAPQRQPEGRRAWGTMLHALNWYVHQAQAQAGRSTRPVSPHAYPYGAGASHPQTLAEPQSRTVCDVATPVGSWLQGPHNRGGRRYA